MTISTAVVQGTGLIGASVGLALRAQGWRVLGCDVDSGTLDEAVRRGAIEDVVQSPTEGDPDLIVLATPPDTVVETLSRLNTNALVTDVAGVKIPVVAGATGLARFVGGHPMAGGETSGAGLARSSLFHGATWVLTTDGAADGDLGELEAIVTSFGANPVRMTAAEHDRAVARISHLPHVLAAALVDLVGDDPSSVSLAGGGFRDLTRVASATGKWWTDVLIANRAELSSALSDLGSNLEEWMRSLTDQDVSAIGDVLDGARSARDNLGEHNAQVRVILMDEPGEIARVGHALETSKVDVRDFQLRHGEHGGGGVLTISVRPRGKSALMDALVAEGFELQ